MESRFYLPEIPATFAVHAYCQVGVSLKKKKKERNKKYTPCCSLNTKLWGSSAT